MKLHEISVNCNMLCARMNMFGEKKVWWIWELGKCHELSQHQMRIKFILNALIMDLFFQDKLILDKFLNILIISVIWHCNMYVFSCYIFGRLNHMLAMLISRKQTFCISLHDVICFWKARKIEEKPNRQSMIPE